LRGCSGNICPTRTPTGLLRIFKRPKKSSASEEILREHPAPEPTGELLADINSKIAEALSAEKPKTHKLVTYRMAAVAAAIIILVAIGVRFFEKGPAETQAPVTITLIRQVIWESEDISADQAELALLTDELEQIEGEILKAQSLIGGSGRSRFSNI
jgi:hypothetical protein